MGGGFVEVYVGFTCIGEWEWGFLGVHARLLRHPPLANPPQRGPSPFDGQFTWGNRQNTQGEQRGVPHATCAETGSFLVAFLRRRSPRAHRYPKARGNVRLEAQGASVIEAGRTPRGRSVSIAHAKATGDCYVRVWCVFARPVVFGWCRGLFYHGDVIFVSLLFLGGDPICCREPPLRHRKRSTPPPLTSSETCSFSHSCTSQWACGGAS